MNGDARIVKIGSNSPTNDGHLWVWNTEVTPAVWFDTGKFQGQPGDKSYFHIAYCSYPERKVIGATASANKIAMEFSQYADGREYAGRKATHQGNLCRLDRGGEDANSPWKWQEVKGDTGDKGDKGDTGEDGEPPKILNGYPKTQYAIGDSKTIYPTSGWGEAIIDVTESKPYLWSRQEIKYDSGDTLYTGYLMLTNITPASYMFGEWDMRVAFKRDDISYPIVTYLRGAGDKPLYYYPKKRELLNIISLSNTQNIA